MLGRRSAPGPGQSVPEAASVGAVIRDMMFTDFEDFGLYAIRWWRGRK
jgi:hypothetical protein